MPRAMVLPQSAVIDGNVYIRDGRLSYDIHRYDPQTQQWSELPRYQYCDFTMTEFNNQLTCVGGIDVSTPELSKEVAVYSTSQRTWEQPYPPMNTPRLLPAVSTYQQHLVVAGGSDVSDTKLASVEILDTSNHQSQWFSATPLPVNCRRMSPAVINDTLYLLGGLLGKQVLSVSLSALTQAGKLPAQWCTLHDAPLEYSTAIVVHDSLLAVGGTHGGQRGSAIHVYEKNTWTKVEDIPTEREDCTCCLLPSGEILVVGGEDHNGWTSRMDIATV